MPIHLPLKWIRKDEKKEICCTRKSTSNHILTIGYRCSTITIVWIWQWGQSETLGPANATQVNTTEPSSVSNRNDVTSASICRFYRKGACRYGMSGTNCPKLHPKAYRKLTLHGNRGLRGSNGENCNSFHPKMCFQSLRVGQCLTLDCKLRHVAGNYS